MRELEEVLDGQEGSLENQRVEEELGDLLFAAVNLARHRKIDPESALRNATFKFQKRFEFVEEALRRDDLPIQDAGLELLETLWQKAKAQEKQ